MTGMEERNWDVSVCGLNCAKCDLFPERCGGCRGSLEHHWSPDCPFLPCAAKKGVDYCFQCGEFPCRTMLEFADDGWEHHRITVDNLRRMRKVGLQAWLEEQEEVMFCPGWIK